MTVKRSQRRWDGLLQGSALQLACLLALCAAAHATQPHKAPEGLYVHQLGHLLFLLAMVLVCVRLYRTLLFAGRGWTHLKASAVLCTLWNLDSLVAHWLEEMMPAEPFVGQGGVWRQANPRLSFSQAFGAAIAQRWQKRPSPSAVSVGKTVGFSARQGGPF
jgi:hypothetical protein